MANEYVRVRYTWAIRWRQWVRVLLYYIGHARVRAVLTVGDRIAEKVWFNYTAEGHTDLTLPEYFRIRRCERKRKHLGRRINIAPGLGSHHCTYCQCDWRKFDRRARSIA